MTDSKFLIQSVNDWIDRWCERNWIRSNGQRLKNALDFQHLYRALHKFNMHIEFDYVQAHSGVEGNEEADALARAGAKKYRKSRG